jgi:hypothetical protein
MLTLPIHRPTVVLSRIFLALAALLLFRPLEAEAITSGTRYPSNEEQYTLQLINRARTSADGLTILQSFVTNNVAGIKASTTGTASDGTAWSSGYWKSALPDVANSMNYFQVNPGDLKRQFLDLGIPGTPLAWNPYLGNVAAGYNDLVIANKGAGPGFPHSLAPYQNQSTFATYAKRYTDGGYGPLNTINALGENIAPNFFSSALATFAGFMIDWGYADNGIQSQDPEFGSHRINLMGSDFLELGISRKPGWDSTAITEVQEFGRRFSPIPAIVGAVYTDKDSNAFYTPGEGLAQVTVTAAPVGGGTSFQTTTFSSGGYTLPVSNPGNYNVTFTGTSGVLKTASVTIGSENVALDAIVTPVVVPPPNPPPTPTSKIASDINGDGKPDYVLFYSSSRRTEVYYLNGGTQIGRADGPTITAGWKLVGVADFNNDGHPDYLIYNGSKRKTEIWYLNGVTKTGTAAGPTLLSGWAVAGLEDFNQDGKVDLLLYQSSTRQTMVWYLDGVTLLPGNPAGPTIPAGSVIAGVADFNADGKPDLLLFTSNKRLTTVYYLNNATKTGEASGPAQAKGWVVTAVADFDGDKRPDFLNFASSGRKTEIRYLAGLVETGSAAAPVLPTGSVLISP